MFSSVCDKNVINWIFLVIFFRDFQVGELLKNANFYNQVWIIKYRMCKDYESSHPQFLGED